MGRVTGARRPGRSGIRRGLVSLLAGTAVFLSLPAPASQDPVPAADAEPAVPAINYAVAVDESGSVTPEDTAAEMAAAQRIALGDLSTSSEITIFGFASADRPVGVRSTPPVRASPWTRRDASASATAWTRWGAARGPMAPVPIWRAPFGKA